MGAGRRVTASLLIVGAFALAACSQSHSGDPGQRRLHELAAEPVFALTPPGLAAPVVPVQTKAHERPGGFEAGGWEGPSVVASFTTTIAPAAVLAFYDAKAVATGWRGTAIGAFRVTDRWTKTYPDGVTAYLIVNVLSRGSPWSYQLAASAPAAV